MQKFPKTVMGFYANNFWRYAGVFILIFSMLSIVDSAGLYIMPSFFLKKTVSILGNTTAANALAAIIPVALVYFFLRLAQFSSEVLRWTIVDNKVRYKAYNQISTDLYDYVFKQNIEFYSNTMPGRIGSQVHQIAESFNRIMLTIFGDFVAVGASVIIATGGMLVIGWEYMVFITITFSIRFFWGMAFMRKALNAASDRANSLNSLQGRLLDAVSNFTVVKLFALAKQEQESVKPARRSYEKAARHAHFLSRWLWGPGNFAMEILGGAALIVLCGYMFSIGKSSIADVSFALSVYVAVSGLAFNLVNIVKDFIDQYGNAVGSYNNLIKPITIFDVPNAAELKVSRGAIEIRNLSFKYHKKMVLDNLSLNIKSGEKVGLVGVSGAGKTTLVNLLMRLYDPVRGGIFIDGQNIHDVTQDSLRENIGFIPQEPAMFNRTLRENIGYGKINATDAEIRRAAKHASADKFIMDAQKKYDTIVGDRGIKLSGGQRQRIAIARAFLKDAPILILDEATAALDSETENVIQKSFEELSRGRTTIAIAHRLSTLRNMDRIIVMDGGKIVESGTHTQLLRKRDGIYARLWKMQSGGFIQE